MSTCYCDYDSIVSVYRQATHTARKNHKCAECGSTIRAGERYESTFGIWDGDATVYKTCDRCVSFRTWLSANTPCFCWAHGSLFEDAYEHFEAVSGDLLCEAPGVLFNAGRRYVKLRDRARADKAERTAARTP